MSRVHQSVARAWNALGTNSEEKAAILNLLSKYPELDETLLKWFWVTKSQEKYFILNQFCSLKQRFTQPISVRSCSNVYTNRGIDCFWLVSLLLNCWLAYYFCGLKKSVYWKIVPCKHDQIKMRDYMEITPPHLTSNFNSYIFWGHKYASVKFVSKISRLFRGQIHPLIILDGTF